MSAGLTDEGTLAVGGAVPSGEAAWVEMPVGTGRVGRIGETRRHVRRALVVIGGPVPFEPSMVHVRALPDGMVTRVPREFVKPLGIPPRNMAGDPLTTCRECGGLVYAVAALGDDADACADHRPALDPTDPRSSS